MVQAVTNFNTRCRAIVGAAGFPIGIWVVAAGVVVATCVVAGRSPFRTDTWAYGDPALYVDIARRGYNLFPCGPAPTEWCGNAAWFPAYPWLVRWVGDLGIGIAPAALALAWLFDLGTVILLWATFLERRLSATAAVVLVYAAFAPGQAFDFAMYPLSMFAFLTVAYLWLVTQEHWLAAGLVGFVLVLVYPVSVAAPAAATVWILVGFTKAAWRERLRRITLAAGLPALSFGLLLAQFQVTLGHWNAFFLISAKYRNNPQDPLEPAFRAAAKLLGSPGLDLDKVPALQTLIVSAALFSVVVAAGLHRRTLARTDLMVVLWAIATWLLSQGTANVNLPRTEATLLPLALLVGLLPRRLGIAFAIAAVALVVPMEVLYLRNALG